MDNSQSQEDPFSEIVRNFSELINTSFNIQGYTCSQNGDNIKCFFPSNRGLMGSKFSMDKNKPILHFTSFQALMSIINDGAIRLYNLENSTDITEYSYVSELTQKFYDEICDIDTSIAKENLYSLSCSPKNQVKDKKHWYDYGEKMKGVAIEFKIVNNPANWDSFYFSKIQYDKKDDFEHLIQYMGKVRQEFPHIQTNFMMSPFFALYKSKDFHLENEVRILFNDINPLDTNRFKNMIFKDIKFDKIRIGKNVKFLRLPLFRKGMSENIVDDSCKERLPQLEITKIYLGPECVSNEKEYLIVKDKLRQIVVEKLGYEEVEIQRVPW